MKEFNQHDIACHDTNVMEHTVEHETIPCQFQRENAHFVSQPLCEEDILCLQELFLSNGWHCISVDDIHAGRSMVSTMLYSLNYYHDIACLTVAEQQPLDSRCCDLYTKLLEKGHLDSQSYDIEEFFLEDFYADFLWIEETEELKDAAWYNHFLQTVHDLKIDNHMPIILLSYR